MYHRAPPLPGRDRMRLVDLPVPVRAPEAVKGYLEAVLFKEG